MKSSKVVRFTEDDCVLTYDNSEEKSSTDWIRAHNDRYFNERRVIRKPRSQLKTMLDLVACWREHETCVVFGNLGRQPHLLNYFLDFCFGHEDNVRVQCEWDLEIPYQTETGGSHFLILVEPYFGFCVKRPPTTQHLVVLTSHMNLDMGGAKKYRCHLPVPKNFADPHLEEGELFRPPLFHLGELPPVPDAVILDVTGAACAWEAYLMLLTGREIIRGRPFKVRIEEQQRKVLESHIGESRRRVERYWPSFRLENVYWRGFF